MTSQPVSDSGAIVDARVITLDVRRPRANCIVWRDGRIVAVGVRAEIDSHLDRAMRIVSAEGAAVLPGFVDAHIHPFHGTLLTRGADLRTATTLDEIRERLRAERDRVGRGGWVLGHSVGYGPFSETGISAAEIEDALDGAPAFIGFFDGHTALASFEALRRAGIDGAREFAENAEIVCDPDGHPTGALLEFAAMDAVRRIVPELTQAERLDAFSATLSRLNAVGLTGVHAMLGAPELLDDCRALEARGDLTVRTVIPMHLEPATPEAEIEQMLETCDQHGDLWRAGTAKFFLDGVLDTGTAWQVDPGPNNVNSAPFWPDLGHYRALVERFTAAGFSCITHAVGDGAVREALDAYKQAGPPRRGMHRVEHIETLMDEDLPRFKELGVAASMQPLHMEGLDTEAEHAWLQGLAPGRRERGFRCADIARTGAVLALGSDWMVADYDPRIGMAWARLRRKPKEASRTPFIPEQALDARTVLHGYTTSPAAINGDELGVLAVGTPADITVLGEDPLETEPDDLVDVEVLQTVVNGRTVHIAARLDEV